MRNQITTITPEKIVGYRWIARIQMMLSGKDVHQSPTGLIATKTKDDRILLYLPNGDRFTNESAAITVEEARQGHSNA